jgi:regulator of sigma E protease
MSTLWDLSLVLLGFTLIIVLHELGHFLAAKWAGVRVLAFAVGFGKALFSYRKGLGWQAGSSEAKLRDMKRDGTLPANVSPTEYRFNMLPFGGYVKMLGQDDADPTAISTEPDSYQRCSPPKKLVIISAGVVMNVIAALALFIIVMMAGRQVEPPVIGSVEEGSPAQVAGLQAGDRVLSIDGHSASTFEDIVLESAMAKKNTDLSFVVQSEGESAPRTLLVRPEVNQVMGLLDIGALPARDLTLFSLPKSAAAAEQQMLRAAYDRAGLQDVAIGAAITHVAGEPVQSFAQAQRIASRAASNTIDLTLQSNGSAKTVQAKLAPTMQRGLVPWQGERVLEHRHALGLSGVLMVSDAAADTRGYELGLRTGDIFARLGDIEFPSESDGIRQIRSSAGKTIAVTVLRKDEAGTLRIVELPNVSVTREGTIGFSAGQSFEVAPVLSSLPSVVKLASGETASLPARQLSIVPGTRIIAVDGAPVATVSEAVSTIQRSLAQSSQATSATSELPPIKVSLTLERFSAASGSWDNAQSETMAFTLDAEAQRQLALLRPALAIPEGLFAPLQTTLKAQSPWQAVVLGFQETHRKMLKTYLTFARIVQGTLKVEHLKGPVGIAHMGTLLAGRGFMWLLFFLAIVNINLAVINFLPLPIVDGGQALMIIYEWIRGKPVPIAFQNAVMIAGMLLIGSIFIFVTFNDVRNLFGI